MGIKFNLFLRFDGENIHRSQLAEDIVKTAEYQSIIQIFLSHKTGDPEAENIARYIQKKHRVNVYVAEWDDNVYGDSNHLPSYIMNIIKLTDGFLVNATRQVKDSMWIGYEVGGAHASEKIMAKTIFEYCPELPSVVSALRSLKNYEELDKWIENLK